MNALTTPAKITYASPLMDPAAFDQMQRVGRMLALSPLFPEHLRKGSAETAIANGVLVMNMATRLNEDPLTVAQNIYFVSGKPGWSSSYMISKANQHGVFKNPINWTIEGQADTLAVTAFADLAATGDRVQVCCDMKMAKAEGWTKNSKYQSMPEQMLRYRSATFLIRLYCPEVMVGVPSQVEIELGMKDVTPADYAEQHAARAQTTKAEPQDAEIIEEEDHDPETGEVAKEAAKSEPKTTGPDVDRAVEREKLSTADNAQREDMQKARDEAQEKPKRAPDPEQFRTLLEMMKRDLMDAGSTSDVADLYAPQIEQMKDSAPELHAELMAEFEAFDTARSEQG